MCPAGDGAFIGNKISEALSFNSGVGVGTKYYVDPTNGNDSDDGLTYTKCSDATIASETINKLVQLASGRIIAGSAGNGAFYSDDNGLTWTQCTTGTALTISGLIQLDNGRVRRSNTWYADAEHSTYYDLEEEMDIAARNPECGYLFKNTISGAAL